MLLSIIIVTYNSSGVLKDCLESIRNNKNNLGFEVIIADNNSIGENEHKVLATIEQEFKDLNIKLIRLSENCGFGAANNQGAKIAQGKYLLILNADTKLSSGKDAFQKLITFMEDHSEAGIASPKLLTSNGTVQEWGCGFKTSLSRVIKYNFGFTPKKLWNVSRPIEVFWVSGAALCIQKQIFEKLCGFDENFFMYFEDEDLCWRTQELGYKVYYMGNISITHLGGQSFKNENVKLYQKKYFYESMVYFYKKHYGPLRALIVRIITYIIMKVKTSSFSAVQPLKNFKI